MINKPIMTNKPHVHAEVIKAWADGAQIQFDEDPSNGWLDCLDNHPSWKTGVRYRVKPETIRYRVALMGREPHIATYEDYARTLSNLATFNRWLTDWTEVEV